MKKILFLLLFCLATSAVYAQKFNGRPVVHAKIDPVTNALKISDTVYKGSRTELLALYDPKGDGEILRQPLDTMEVNLGAVKLTTRLFRKKFKKILEVTTFRKQGPESLWAGQWLAFTTVTDDLLNVIVSQPQRF